MDDSSSFKADPRPWFALLLASYVICGLMFKPHAVAISE